MLRFHTFVSAIRPRAKLNVNKPCSPDCHFPSPEHSNGGAAGIVTHILPHNVAGSDPQRLNGLLAYADNRSSMCYIITDNVSPTYSVGGFDA